ncbi:mitochondrial ATP synthase epsilon chain-domain-containing protein [Syncephalastrum racemosum]|uniref:Mitochondrial ATP synthase epsilon chain-domain-containing protein n=1 Tax=Syncephalastrum racemosum TaxID=13706 RepID=A0A1X2HCJ9_SYNRA|nr:mitochondrial ATP synthase epsilon chain-domain-containing protein [Syncephalastrum racemosum]
MSWKAAGLSYLQYANICARAVRNTLKDDLRVAALRRDEGSARVAQWVNGKQQEQACILTISDRGHVY